MTLATPVREPRTWRSLTLIVAIAFLVGVIVARRAGAGLFAVVAMAFAATGLTVVASRIVGRASWKGAVVRGSYLALLYVSLAVMTVPHHLRLMNAIVALSVMLAVVAAVRAEFDK